MTEAAIDHGFTRDIYLSLGSSIDDRTWEVRIHIKPFINWIWIGCLIMALGGLFAISDRRYRLRRAKAEQGATAGATAAS
jgi:cytochrome c-type biogenesis protein CcmF